MEFCLSHIDPEAVEPSEEELRDPRSQLNSKIHLPSAKLLFSDGKLATLHPTPGLWIECLASPSRLWWPCCLPPLCLQESSFWVSSRRFLTLQNAFELGLPLIVTLALSNTHSWSISRLPVSGVELVTSPDFLCLTNIPQNVS